MTSTENSQINDYYEDNSSIFETLNIDGYIADDMYTGPTYSTSSSDDATFTVHAASGDALATRDMKAGVNPKQHMRVFSDGVLETSSTNINAYDLGTERAYRVKGPQYTDYHEYSAIDASSASGYVTYYGIDKSEWKSSYTKYSVGYEWHNFFKGGDYGNKIYGGSYGDTLIGGTGDDTFHLGDGDNLVYTIGGDNIVYGGSGNDTIFGGYGDDVIQTGYGDNTIVLEAGDNLVVATTHEISGTSTNFYVDKIVCGTGSDTLVFGNIPASVTTTTTTGYDGSSILADGGVSAGETVAEAGIEAISDATVVGALAAGVISMVEDLFDGDISTTTTTTSWDDSDNASIVYDYNPVTDRMLIALSDDSDITVESDTTGASAYQFVVDDNEDAAVKGQFASAEEIFGEYRTGDDLQTDEIDSFYYSMNSNSYQLNGSTSEVDWNGFTVTDTEYADVTFDAETGLSRSLADELGTNDFAAIGAWQGSVIIDDSKHGYGFGTDYDDVLFGYNPTKDNVSGTMTSFYGFGGDDIFAPGQASGNVDIYGGGGDNTVTFAGWNEYTAGSESMGDDVYIYVDMTDKHYEGETKYGDATISDDSTETKADAFDDQYGEHYEIDAYGKGIEYVYYVYQAESITGSAGNDTLIGDDADNTFTSTDGDNLWTGGDGADTFVLTGGSATITDFNAEDGDSIVVHSADYSASSSDYEWDQQSDGSWVLTDTATDETVVTLSNDNHVDAAPDVTLYNDTSDASTTPTITTHYYDAAA